MLIYIFVFLLSIIFTIFCEGSEKKSYRISFALIAILIPSLLAGFRDYGVGYDTQIYVDDTYREVLDYRDLGLWSFLKAMLEGEFTLEPFYCFINYIGLQLGIEVNYVYFIVNFVTIALVFNAIWLYQEKASMPLMMFVFLFLYFNISLNIIRQTVAIALALNVYLYLEQRRWIMALVFGVLMFLSHTTSIVFILFLLLYFAINRGVGFKIVIGLILIVPLVFLMLEDIVLLAISLNMVPTRFINYILEEEDTAVMKTAVAYGWLVLGAMIWGGYTFLIKKEYFRETYFILNVKLFSNLLILASTVSLWAFRTAYYFGVFDILFIPRIIHLVSEEDEEKGKILSYFFVILIIFYWYWSIIYNNENETYPYKSEILGI